MKPFYSIFIPGSEETLNTDRRGQAGDAGVISWTPDTRVEVMSPQTLGSDWFWIRILSSHWPKAGQDSQVKSAVFVANICKTDVCWWHQLLLVVFIINTISVIKCKYEYIF